MAGSYISMPLGMGGAIDPPAPAMRAGALPDAHDATHNAPIGLAPAFVPPRPQAPDDEPLRGETQLPEAVGAQWWEAELSETPHPVNADWPRTIKMTIGRTEFLLTENAVKHMAERMPAKRRRLESGGAGATGRRLINHELTHVQQQGGAAASTSSGWPSKWQGPVLKADTAGAVGNTLPSWAWAVSSGKSGADFPLSSLAGALEKLAVRLPGKPKKHHKGMIVDDWELGVTTEDEPWRVTHAVYKPADSD